MNAATIFVFLLAQLGQSPSQKGDSASLQAARSKRERLLEIYTNEAAGYVIYHDASRKERVELQHEPVYVWTNPVRDSGQDGAVFVWTCRGRAEVLGCFFSAPSTGPRKLYHEFHSLSLLVLDVSRTGSKNWTPEAPGIELTPIADAPGPGRSASQRLAQMRALTHDFSASTKDDKAARWELRLLPQPFYRYKSTDPDVLDGAVFAFVTSAGTDPEALLVLEARKPADNVGPVWHYAVARFTDLNLWVRHKGTEVFFAPYIPHGLPRQDPKHRYRVFHDRNLAPVEEKAQ
ncbi:MAG: hypothetical protein ACHRXM_28255 [Isosphaerales bacterium]